MSFHKPSAKELGIKKAKTRGQRPEIRGHKSDVRKNGKKQPKQFNHENTPVEYAPLPLRGFNGAREITKARKKRYILRTKETIAGLKAVKQLTDVHC